MSSVDGGGSASPSPVRAVLPCELLTRPKRRAKRRDNPLVQDNERELQHMASTNPDLLAEEIRINKEKNTRETPWNEYSHRILLTPISPLESTAAMGTWRELSESPYRQRPCSAARSPSPARAPPPPPRAATPGMSQRRAQHINHGSDFGPHYLWCT